MSEYKVEGRNAVTELLKSDKTVNKLMIQKGERQGSINEIIKKGAVISQFEPGKSNIKSNFIKRNELM